MIFTTSAKQKDKTPWRWPGWIETCRSAYDIQNIVYIYVCVVHLLFWIINCHPCLTKGKKSALCIWKSFRPDGMNKQIFEQSECL